MKKITFLILSALCGIGANAQFYENFDTANNPVSWNLPTGQWSTISSGTGTDWEISPSGSTTYPANTQPHAALITPQNIGAGNSSSDYLVTPLINMPPNGLFRFFSRTLVAGNQGTTYQIRVAPGTADPTQISSFSTVVVTWNENEISTQFNFYQEKSVTLPNLGIAVYVAFVRNFSQTGSNGSDGWLVDDISNFPIASACGGFLSDPGGSANNYPNNSNETVTICPEAPGDQVTVTFTQFNVEAQNDGLYVFDGPSTATPQIASTNGPGFVPGGLAGAYWGSSLPGPFTSSSPDGCLTFQFRSNATGNAPGYLANITCGPPDECPTPAIQSVETLETTAEVNWWSQGVTESFQVLALPCGSPEPTIETQGIPASSSPFTVESLDPNVCYAFYVRSNCGAFGGQSQWSFAVYATTSVEKRILNAFVDTNDNGVKDNNESAFNLGFFSIEQNGSGFVQQVESTTGTTTITAQDPTDFFDVGFTVFPEFAGYYSVDPATYTNVTIPEGSGPQFLYFPVTLSQPYQDAAVTVSALGAPRPGMQYSNIVTVYNYGVTPTSGTVTYTADPHIASISAVGATITPTGFTYNFTDLAPMSSISITANLTVVDLPSIQIGQIVTNTATVTASGTELTLSNNSAQISQATVNSYDPNDIMESHGPQIDVDEFSDADYLYYTIRFQNTGNAEAINIRIENTLDDQLDAESLRMVGASHAYQMTRTGNDLTFRFDGINLTWQSQSDELSQGWLTYRIKVDPGFEVGDIIPNVANIYFDTNPAIVTNTFGTEFVEQLELPEFDANQLLIWPNPATDKLQIRLDVSAGFDKVEIYDIVGKKVGENTLESGAAILDISALPSGLYLVKACSFQGGTLSKKLIVE